jgi:hypothetical protein
VALGVAAGVLPAAAVARAADWYVDATAGAGGDGSMADPFTQIQDALDVATAGDVIHVLPGTYAPIATVVDGTPAAPITVQAEPAGDAVVQASGTALEAHHEHHTFQGLVLDGGYGAGDAVDADGANFLELFDVEVRRSGGDCIDLHTVEGVLIANSRIHHCVAEDAGAVVDAHGVTGDSVFDLEIRDSEIYLCSGDAVQMSPPRLPWDELRIRRSTLWTGALDEDAGPIAAGTIVGENALDTKVGAELDGSGSPPTVEIEDVVAYGFRGFIDNQAAWNLKEDVGVTIDRVTVYDTELAFRLRGPASVQVRNAVVYDVDGAVRYEDGLPGAQILASTFGGEVLAAFVDGGGDPPVGLVVEDLLVLGDAVPDEAAGGMANLAAGPEAFVDAAAHDYHLVASGAPVDAGVALDGVMVDRDGTFRPVGRAFDVGAYEWHEDPPPPPPPDDDSGGAGSGGVDDTGGSSGAAGTTSGTGDSGDDIGPGPVTTGFEGTGGEVSGCGCRSGRGGAGPWLLVGLVAGLRLRRRAARRRAALAVIAACGTSLVACQPNADGMGTAGAGGGLDATAGEGGDATAGGDGSSSASGASNASGASGDGASGDGASGASGDGASDDGASDGDSGPVDLVCDNVLVNPSLESGDLEGWQVLQAGEARVLEESAHEGTHSLRTSYGAFVRQQEVDLVAAGLDPAFLDTSPDVRVGEWVQEIYASDHYWIDVELRDANHAPLDAWHVDAWTPGRGDTYDDDEYYAESHTFRGYPPGLRYVHFLDGGVDGEYWVGLYGAVLDDARVEICHPR